MKKRIFSATLAGCMMLTMVPVTAFAAEEGVTEVSVEQYAAKAPTLEVVGFTDADYTAVITTAGVEWGATRFMNEKKELIPVVNLTDFTSNTDPGGVALTSGYYVPLKLTAYGADADTTVVHKNGEPMNYDDPYASRKDKTITHDKFDAWSSDTVKGTGTSTEQNARKDVLYILVQVARLDGKLRQSTVTVEIYPDGVERTEKEDIQTVSFDLTDLTLVPSEYMKAEKLEPCADAKKTINAKKVSETYDASTQTVKKYSDSKYYLPFSIPVDKDEDGRVKVETKAPDGTYTTVQAGIDAHATGKAEFDVELAGTDGKLAVDEIRVTIQPEGTDAKLLAKELTFNTADVTLEKDAVTMTARLPEASKVTGANYLTYRNNLAAVKGIALKDGVLTITADLNAVVAGNAASVNDDLPVLFTMTRDGKSCVQAQPDVKNFGGVSLTDFVVNINLRASEADQDTGIYIVDTAGDSHNVKLQILNASKVPTLEDSTVKVENSTMTGMTAEVTAKTAADVKAMYKENGGSVTVTTPAGVTMADDAAVGTGCLIVLKDRDGNVIDTITVVVKGDVRGNGVMGLGQLVAAAQAVKGTASLTGPFLAAGDFNGDGAISLGDLVGMAALLK